LTEKSSHTSIKKLSKYCSEFVTLPGRFGGGTKGGWMMPLSSGFRMGSSLGGGSDRGIKICVTRHVLMYI